MADWTKTEQAFLTHQLVTHPATVKGAQLSVVDFDSVDIDLFHAPIEATANTDPGSFLIQKSSKSSGNEDWVTIVQHRVSAATSVLEAMTATEASGETALAVASTTGFAAEDEIYIRDAGTLANSEWALIEQIVANTSIDIMHGLTTGKDSSDVIHSDAERVSYHIDCRGISRLQVIFQHEGATGAKVHVKAIGISADAFV